MRFLAAIVVGMVALTVAACGSSTPTPTIDVEWAGRAGTQRSTATPVPADPNSVQWGGGTGIQLKTPTPVPVATKSVQWGGGTGIQLTEGVELAMEAQPRPGWTSVSVAGLSAQQGFSLRLPAGWKVSEPQGVDPYVAEVVGDGIRLTLYYGELSRDLNPADDPEHDYSVILPTVGGVQAKLLVSTDVSGGFAGISFPSRLLKNGV